MSGGNGFARPLRHIAALALWTCAAHAIGDEQRFCGGAAQGHPVGDLSLEHIAQQPASMMTCASGYMFEKCGDHVTANLVFDKCIAAGYTGALIWKGLMYENGNGVEQDFGKAVELFKQAAMSGNDGYATLGKVHYASALHEGKGVPRDEAEALKWFQAAAAEGNEDAKEFLRTGHHTAGRDHTGAGVGTARAAVEGVRLEKATAVSLPALSLWSGLLLAGVFAIGLVRQATSRMSHSNARGVQS